MSLISYLNYSTALVIFYHDFVLKKENVMSVFSFDLGENTSTAIQKHIQPFIS